MSGWVDAGRIQPVPFNNHRQKSNNKCLNLWHVCLFHILNTTRLSEQISLIKAGELHTLLYFCYNLIKGHAGKKSVVVMTSTGTLIPFHCKAKLIWLLTVVEIVLQRQEGGNYRLLTGEGPQQGKNDKRGQRDGRSQLHLTDSLSCSINCVLYLDFSSRRGSEWGKCDVFRPFQSHVTALTNNKPLHSFQTRGLASLLGNVKASSVKNTNWVAKVNNKWGKWHFCTSDGLGLDRQNAMNL